MPLLKPGSVNVVMGGQFGSEGKGKTYGHLYATEKVDLAVCDFMPNAGHTCHLPGECNTKVVSKILPLGAWFGVPCAIGPHAVFSLPRLLQEVESVRLLYPNFHPVIHPLACVLTEDNIAKEQAGMRGISSTMQGSAEALIDKIRRPVDGGGSLAGGNRLLGSMWNWIGDTFKLVQSTVRAGGTVLAETAQGFDLGLNNGYAYPFCTSRDCMVGRVLDNAGVSPRMLGNIIGVLRTFPIRVGNVEGGWSGPHYEDQYELTWGAVSEIRGIPTEERTTVTNRIRRVFSFSMQQLERFLSTVMPDYLVLNFADYLPENTLYELMRKICTSASEHGVRLTTLGTGPLSTDVVEVSTLWTNPPGPIISTKGSSECKPIL